MAKQNQITTLQTLNDYAYENIFSVYQEDNQYYYNLLNTITFPQKEELDPSLFTLYTLTSQDIWPLISYKQYGTIQLWWIICIANNIQNPLVMPKAGTKIIIPVTSVVNEVLATINS